MSSALAERAMVAPAYVHRPARARSLATEVTRVCASVGRILDEEQQLAVDVLTGLKPDGTPAALEAAVISARQNLKTFILEGIALTLLLDPHNRVRLGIWSAQEFDTAQETFRNFAELFESPERFPHLARRVKDIRRGSGKEEIELLGGRRLKFKARSGKGARGLSGDFVILDEAFALDAGHMGALLPTLSTRRRAMVFYGSSAGKAESEVLRRVRDRGRAGGPAAPAYVEWAAPGTLAEPGCETGCRHAVGAAGCVLDREDYWMLANPAMGRRITADYIRAERSALPPAEFARERLGWWDEPAGSDPEQIPADAWAACADPGSAPGDGVVFAVDMSPGGTSCAIAVAGRRPDGKAHVGIVDYRPGTEWVAERLVQLVADHDPLMGVVWQPTAPVGALIDRLEAKGVWMVAMAANDMTQACGALRDQVLNGEVCHQGITSLDDAFAAAERRVGVEGTWVWGRRTSAGDICPLVAATEALWGLAKSGDREPNVYEF